MPADNQEQAATAKDRGLLLHDRYEQAGDTADLDRAVHCFRTAASKDARHGVYWSNPGNALRARYERTGEEQDRHGAPAARPCAPAVRTSR
jgi:hypothetical protein